MKIAFVLSLPIISALAFTGCGPTVKFLQQKNSQNIYTVAILPPTFPAAVQREKIIYTQKALAAELQSAGYSVLDERIVEQVCKSPECPEREQLVGRYGVEGFIRLFVDSTTRANFVAGYYNSISGSLTLFNREFAPVVQVDHTESQRGGVVFNSGQVIQGVISQLKSGTAESQNDLAGKFARTIVAKLPNAGKPERTDQLEENLVEIRSASLKALKKPAYEICVDATPASMASLVLDRRKFVLKEISPGKYCGAYRADEIASRELGVEVRSPYGAAVRQMVSGPRIDSCDINGRIRVESAPKGAKLTFECVQLGDDAKSVVGKCDRELRRCQSPKFVIYRAPGEQGPYLRVAETMSTIYQDQLQGVTPSTVYGVLAFDQSGTVSRPVSGKFLSAAEDESQTGSQSGKE